MCVVWLALLCSYYEKRMAQNERHVEQNWPNLQPEITIPADPQTKNICWCKSLSCSVVCYITLSQQKYDSWSNGRGPIRKLVDTTQQVRDNDAQGDGGTRQTRFILRRSNKYLPGISWLKKVKKAIRKILIGLMVMHLLRREHWKENRFGAKFEDAEFSSQQVQF